jgi:GcrA cell cycle regulator
MAGVRNPNTEDWTPARVSKLIDLKKKGRSASQIAKALGGTTRSAVISKMRILGFRTGPATGGDMMGNSANPGVKTKALAFDVSPAELLRPRRFTWEDPTP